MSITFEKRTYQRADCVTFRKTSERFGGLSNMAPGFPLKVNGVTIRTAEALYQACRFPHLPQVQMQILGQSSPMTAKMVSKPYRGQSRRDWHSVRVEVMRWCLRVKLAQNWRSFSALLLSTDDRQIVEDSARDDFWGAKAEGEKSLRGINVLGQLLMELRDELQEGTSEASMRAELPPVPDLLLLGKPIAPTAATESAITRPADLFAAPEAGGSDAALTQHTQSPTGAPMMGIPRECKRLAEVDFPITAVSRHSAREKSIRHGHPSALHLWWARRPLAACRAVLMGLLLPDPCDPACPKAFKAAARQALRPVPGIADPKDDAALRKALLRFIADAADWEHSAEPIYLAAARSLVYAAIGTEPPLVVDPFAGGGAIPLEALRVGCDAHASDLNPVAGLILKTVIEEIPRHGAGLAEELRQVGESIKAKAKANLAVYYPKDPDGSEPMAYLWARTMRCESPSCGAEIPLFRSLWLSKKASRRRALKYTIDRPKGAPPRLKFEVFRPESEAEVQRATVSGARATCPCCGTVLPAPRVRAQLAAQRGGADTIFSDAGRRVGGALLLAVVTLKDGSVGREYRLPTERDYRAVWAAQKAVAAMPKGALPDEPLPPIGTLGFRVQRYGMVEWGDLFAARQKLALAVIGAEIKGYADQSQTPVVALCALALGKAADLGNSGAPWKPGAECPVHLLSSQKIPPLWDWSEAVLTSESSGSFSSAIERSATAIASALSYRYQPGASELADATATSLPDECAALWFTDPPYYNAIPYADLSDFFFVWLKRAMPGHPVLRNPFEGGSPLTPKGPEIIQDETKVAADGRPKDKSYFEDGMARAFAEGRRVLTRDGVGCVVFAHKTTEGWEALLSGMLRAGWVITASWPITTEMASRLRARESAALAASVHLVCRPRSPESSTGGWEDILRELPGRIGDWMERLSGEAIRGADLVFSCIGPAMELFSRYPKVETAEGEEVTLAPNPDGRSPAAQRGFLSYVWEAVGRAALRQVLGQAEGEATNGSAAAALEEDARLTALFLWTLQSAGNGQSVSSAVDDEIEDEADDEDDEAPRRRQGRPGFTLIYDIARRFAQPLGIHLDEWQGRVIDIERGVVRLLSVAERSEQLFGSEGAAAMAEALERGSIRNPQLGLFPEDEGAAAPRVRGRATRRGGPQSTESGDRERRREPTTLDRVHAAMLLQASGQSGALRALLEEEQRRGPDFFRLANALSALYPRASEEKRLVDAMLVAVPR